MVCSPLFSSVSAPVTTMAATGSPSIFAIAVGGSGSSIPAISHVGLMALCALLVLVGLVAVRAS
jgi:hypothetical protein